MKTMQYKIIILIFTLVFYPYVIFGHGSNKHEKIDETLIETKKYIYDKTAAYKIINKQYREQIRPIFKKKCFDCHSDMTNYPWYYTIPGIKQMMDYDIKEAKKHIDMSKDFPFISHETPLKDLDSIREIVLNVDMPPLRYILAHWDAGLTQDEKESIIK